MAQGNPSTVYAGSAPEDGGVYFLYNVGTGKWLNQGYGLSNKQAGVDEVGMEVQLESCNGGGC